MSIIRSDEGKALYPVPNVNYVSESSLTGGGATVTLTVNTTLGRNGNRGYIKNDGAGDFTIQFSMGGTNYNTAFTLKQSESFDLTGMSINSIKLIPGTSNSSYRVHVW
jgi:hypothetical protein